MTHLFSGFVGNPGNAIAEIANAVAEIAMIIAYIYLPTKPSLDMYPKHLPAISPAVF
ncbi:MAG: hypothetical protein V7K18_24975 [Nostoc sp.]|uniref:hypothetical protein n=1 Tax=Nostoc sp. TaxID=1180 RepID=UPI002FF54464